MTPSISSVAARAALFASALACVACATPRIDPPAGYVQLHDARDRAFAAVSARGNTFAVTDRPNEGGKSGDQTYWTEAFKHEKVTLGRYRLATETDIRTGAGRDGRLLDLRLGQGAAEYTWLVALFVDPSRIVTVEAGGPTAQIEPDREKLLAAVRTLH